MTKLGIVIIALTLMSPAFAGHWRDHGDHFYGAPGPIAGAGLPVLAIGYGVYWLVRRRRKV